MNSTIFELEAIQTKEFSSN